MRKIILIVLVLFSASIAFAQMETIKEDYVSTSNAPPDLSSKVFKSFGVDYSESYKAGWDSANEVWGLEGAGLTFLEEVDGVSQLKTINEYCGEIGLGLAFIQLGLDLSEGKKTEGVLNFTKNSFNYAIGKWGWQSLKIASCGVAVIDYALQKFGKTLLGWKYSAWESAYTRYFEVGPGKRSITEWKQVFQGVNSQEDVMNRINQHLNKFDWGYDTMKEWTAEPSGLIRADPLAEDKEKIKGSYLNTYLMPYLKSLFLKLQEEANYQAWKATQDSFQKAKKVLNTVYNLQVKVVGAKTKIAGLKVAINNWGGVTDSNGVWKLSYTLYGFIKGGGPEIVLSVPTAKGDVIELKQKMVLKNATVTFQLGGVADVKGIVTDEASKEPVKGAKISIQAAKVSASTNAGGEYLLKDVPNGDYQVAAEHRAYEKKSVPLKIDVPEEATQKQTIQLDITLKALPPAVDILFPKEGQLVENLQPVIRARVNAGGAGINRDAIKMTFDGTSIDFNYNEGSGDITYTPPALLKEDVPTKAKHNVTLTAEVTDEKGQKKTISKTVNFTAGIRPQITELQFNDNYLKEPDKEPLFTGQVYDEHSGPDPGTLMVLLNGNPVKASYGIINEHWLNIVYFPTPSTAMRGGENRVTVTIKDKATIPSQPKTISFKMPGPEIQLVKPVNVSKVISGEAFVLALAAKNIGSGPAKSLRGTLYSNDRNYATVIQPTSSFGDIEPAMEVTGAPLYNIKTAQNLGNPESGEPVNCNFTVRFYQTADPKQFWEDRFSVPIYPGEMLFGTVYVKLIHGTYMTGDWPIHTAYQTVCLSGTGGNFTTTSDANGNATFENIPPGDYTTYVPRWYTHGAKLGEYIKSVTVIAGGIARATLKGSCPYLLVWNGKGFEKDNDIYSTARILATGKNPIEYIPTKEEIERMEYTDYLYIQKKVVPKDEHYVFRLEEIRNEISWTDFVKLMVVDHPKGTKISSDGKGNIYSYSTPVSAISAVDEKENDVLNLLKSQDSLGFKAFHESSVALRFKQDKEIEHARLLIRMKGWERIDREYKLIPMSPPTIQIQVRGEGDKWLTCRSIFPRNEWDLTIVDMTPFFKGMKEAEARLYITQCRTDKYHIIDFVGLDTSKPQELKVTILDVKKAVHSFLGVVTDDLSKEDRIYVQTYPHEWIDIYFDKLEEPIEERGFVFVSRGHYLYFAGDTAVRLKR